MEQKALEKVFDPDKLFQDQQFFYSPRERTNGRHHVVQEIREHDNGFEKTEKIVAVCGEYTFSGTIESLTEKAERKGTLKDSPERFNVCSNCERIVESRTGRAINWDLEKYSGGENQH
jgi:hypothetical protein